jgi:hypothetical protein
MTIGRSGWRGRRLRPQLCDQPQNLLEHEVLELELEFGAACEFPARCPELRDDGVFSLRVAATSPRSAHATSLRNAK